MALPQSAIANNIEPLIHMAEQGIGIVCLPDFAVRQQIEEGGLVAVLADHVQNAGAFRVLWPSSRQLSRKLRVFVDFLAENLFSSTQLESRRLG